MVPQNLSDRSWGIRKGKVSWTGDTLRGDDEIDNFAMSANNKAYLELEHGKNNSQSGSINRVFLDGSVSTVAPRSDSEGGGAGTGAGATPPVPPPKDRDLVDAKYGLDVDRV